MGLSDCEKCWDTPCTCGWDYREWTKKSRMKQAAVVLGVDIKLIEKIRNEIPNKHPMSVGT